MKVLRSSNFIRRTDRGVLSAIARTRSASVATAFGSLAGKSALVLLVLWLRRRNRAIGKAAPLLFDLVRFILETDKHIQRFTAFVCLAKLSVDSCQNVIIGRRPGIERNSEVQSFGPIIEPGVGLASVGVLEPGAGTLRLQSQRRTGIRESLVSIAFATVLGVE